jgi:hypothetical protein
MKKSSSTTSSMKRRRAVLVDSEFCLPMSDKWSIKTSIYNDMTDTCPCCGYMSVGDEYDICEVCNWEDDYVQRRHPEVCGANGPVILSHGQRNFIEIGRACPRDRVTEGPGRYRRNPLWKPLENEKGP